jgi:DNA-binding response OmpR family regulator
VNRPVRIPCCPGCGRPLPDDGIALPRIKRRILDLIHRHPGISAERLRDLIWNDDPNGGPDRKVIHVHIAQLNKLLLPFGIEVRGHVSNGYRVQFHPRGEA